MFFKKRRKTFETRNEYLDNIDFINRFREELIKFGDIKGLTINSNKNEKLENSDIIPLDVKIPVEYGQSYNQLLRKNEGHIWEVILCDDTMEFLNDALKEQENNTNHLELYLTNDCTSFGIYEECLGIEVRY